MLSQPVSSPGPWWLQQPARIIASAFTLGRQHGPVQPSPAQPWEQDKALGASLGLMESGWMSVSPAPGFLAAQMSPREGERCV